MASVIANVAIYYTDPILFKNNALDVWSNVTSPQSR